MKIQLLDLSILTILLFLIFTLLLSNYFLLLKKIDRKYRYLLFSCRCICLFFLIILILNPWINWQTSNASNPDLNIYLDNSKSMNFIESNINFNNRIELINNWSKSNNLNINWYLFGDSIRKSNFKEDILFTDNNSSLQGVKKHIILNNDFNHLIITDGHINKDEILDNIIIDNNNIYISGFGRAISQNDCYISTVNINELDSSLFNLSINLGCFINGQDSVETNFILNNYKNNITSLQSKRLSFDKNGFQDIVFENLRKSDFVNLNEIILETDINELNYYNNKKYFTIKEQEDIKKVLLLSGGISNNTRFIKKTVINQFPHLIIEHYFDNKKLDYDKFDDYSLIILDNFPFSNKDIKDYKYIVSNFSNLPIIYFEGPGVPFSIAEQISNFLDLDLSLNKETNSNLKIINNNFIFNDIDFNKFSPINNFFSWTAKTDSIKPISYFSNNSIASFKNKDLTAVFITNLARIGLIETNLFNTNNVSNYISNIILYEYDSLTKLININIDKIRHSNNNPIYIKVDIDGKIKNTNMFMKIYNLIDKTQEEVSLIDQISNKNEYTYILEKPGIYSIEIVAESDNLQIVSNKKYLVIEDFDIESQFLYQNKKSIHNFSIKNNAVYFDFNELEESLDKIKINKLINVKSGSINSLSTQYYWVLFILLFAIEWYLRKKNKLL